MLAWFDRGYQKALGQPEASLPDGELGLWIILSRCALLVQARWPPCGIKRQSLRTSSSLTTFLFSTW